MFRFWDISKHCNPTTLLNITHGKKKNPKFPQYLDEKTLVTEYGVLLCDTFFGERQVNKWMFWDQILIAPVNHCFRVFEMN